MVPSLGVALGYGNDDAKVVHRIPGPCMRSFERLIAELISKTECGGSNVPRGNGTEKDQRIALLLG